MDYKEIEPILKEHGASIGVPYDSTKHYSGTIEHVSDEEAVRRDHGVGIGVPYDPIKHYSGPVEHVSDEEAVRRDHGVGIGVQYDPIKHYSGPIEHVSDEEAVRRDHGVGIGVPYDPIKHYSGPIEHVSDEEAVRRDHGVGFGRRASGTEIYGTEEKELKKIFQELLYADGVGEIDSEIAKLPDAAIIKIVEQRYRRSINKLTDRGNYNKNGITNIGKSLDVDFSIIMSAIRQKRNIFDSVFDASSQVGEENMTNVMGVIDSYRESIEGVPVTIDLIDGMNNQQHIDKNTGKVLDAITGLEYLSAEAKKVALEEGIDLSNKQI